MSRVTILTMATAWEASGTVLQIKVYRRGGGGGTVSDHARDAKRGIRGSAPIPAP